MSEYMHLVGAEQVQRAANTMQNAADSMSRTQGYMDESLKMFLMRFEELVVRLEQLSALNNDGGSDGR